MSASSTATQPRDLNDQLDDMLRRIDLIEQDLTDPTGPTTSNNTVVTTPGGSIVVIIQTPAVPTGVTLTPGAANNTVFIDATWAGPSDNTASAYEIELAKKVGSVYQTVQATRTGGTTVRFNGLEPHTTYGFRVQSVSNAQYQSAWVPATGYTDCTTGADTSIPAQATGIGAFAGIKSLIVRWNMNTEADVGFGYGTYRCDCATDAAFTAIVKTNYVSAQVTSFDDLASNTQYWVRVAAIDSSGNQGPYSASATATTGQITAPDIVAGTITGDKIAASTVTAANILAGTITGDKIAANTIDANSIQSNTTLTASLTVTGVMTPGGSGGISVGVPPTSGVFIGTSGIRGYSGGAATFILDNSGNATFSGTLAATITNSGTISGGVITGSLIRTSGSTPRVQLDNTGFNDLGAYHRIAFYSANGSLSTPAQIYADFYTTSSWERLMLRPGQFGGVNDTFLELRHATSGGGFSQATLQSHTVELAPTSGSTIIVRSDGTNIAAGIMTISQITCNNNLGVSGTSFLAGVTCSSLSCSPGPKSFVIDHPLDDKSLLVHSAFEGPENAVIYRGQATVGDDGTVVVALPSYFEALVSENDRSVQLTPVYNGSPSQPLSATSPVQGTFMVAGEKGQQFWWTVVGVRKDIDRLVVEPTREAFYKDHGENPVEWSRRTGAVDHAELARREQ